MYVRTRRPPRWRRLLAWVFVLLFCVAAPLGLVAAWGRGIVLNTDRYTETVAPLATNADIRVGISDVVLRAILGPNNENVSSNLTTQLVTRAVTDVVNSGAFATVWEQENRAAHGLLVAALTGEEVNGVEVQDGQVVLNLNNVVTSVLDRLAELGAPQTVIAAIQPPDASLVIMSSAKLDSAQRYTRLLNQLGFLVPLAALVLAIFALIVATNRIRVAGRLGLGLTISMVILVALLGGGRHFYLGALGPNVPRGAATAIFDILIRRLWMGAAILAVGGLLVAIFSFIIGRFRPA